MRDNTRRIFGGKEASGDSYQKALLNEADQAVAETLAVSATPHRRVFPGPRGTGEAWWSYFIDVKEAGGGASLLTFFYSWLPNPDPATAAHWKTSAITVDLTGVASFMDEHVQAAPLWIMASALVETSTADVLGYVRVSGVE